MHAFADSSICLQGTATCSLEANCLKSSTPAVRISRLALRHTSTRNLLPEHPNAIPEKGEDVPTAEDSRANQEPSSHLIRR
jgi:hypothetical protein